MIREKLAEKLVKPAFGFDLRDEISHFSGPPTTQPHQASAIADNHGIPPVSRKIFHVGCPDPNFRKGDVKLSGDVAHGNEIAASPVIVSCSGSQKVFQPANMN